MDQKTRVLLVDDHSLFRESLSRLLQAEPGFEIVASCATIDEAAAVLDRATADVILLDFDLGEEQAPAFLEKWKSTGSAAKILIVTAGMTDAAVRQAFQAGISGVFLKHRPPDQLVNAIHQVLSGDVALDLEAARQLLSRLPTDEKAFRAQDPLSPREQLVIKAIFSGLTNKQVAAELQISESLVKAVLQQLFARFGVRSRSQLVRIALENHSRLLSK